MPSGFSYFVHKTSLSLGDVFKEVELFIMDYNKPCSEYVGFYQIWFAFLIYLNTCAVILESWEFEKYKWICRPLMQTKLKSGTTLVVDWYSYSGVAFSSAKGLGFDWYKVKY